MAQNPDIPPSGTVKPIDAPPESGQPTVAQLKADIDSGRTGEKVGVFDPGLSPLGTDDEAAGHPASPRRIAMARHYENVARWVTGGGKVRATHEQNGVALYGFVGFIVLVGVVFVGLMAIR